MREERRGRTGPFACGYSQAMWMLHGQVGAMIDYLYSKGCYDYQATKHLNWGFSGSYIGDRYEFQGFFNHWNMLNMENGGITDDLYITDPAQLQGGQASIQPQSNPYQSYRCIQPCERRATISQQYIQCRVLGGKRRLTILQR